MNIKSCLYNNALLNFKSPLKSFLCLGQDACVLTFLLWEMLRAPKSLNSEDVGEFNGSVEECNELNFQYWKDERWILLDGAPWLRLTMSAVAEVLGTVVEETGRAVAGSHSLRGAVSRTDVLQCDPQCCTATWPQTESLDAVFVVLYVYANRQVTHLKNRKTCAIVFLHHWALKCAFIFVMTYCNLTTTSLSVCAGGLQWRS